MRKTLTPQAYDAHGRPVVFVAVPEVQTPGAGAKPDAVHAYRRQSATVHVVLALTTLGLGNWCYATYIRLSNKYRL
jgi:hypothetical protein